VRRPAVDVISLTGAGVKCLRGREALLFAELAAIAAGS